MLAHFFDNILTMMRIPSLCGRLPSLFNLYRDKVRDCLSAINPTDFPRFGQIPIPAAEIFVHMGRSEGHHRLVSFKFTCDDESHLPRTKQYGATFVLVERNTPPAGHAGFTPKPTLQQWLSSYFREMRANAPQCHSCCAPYPHSSSSVTPLPWIWIDIPNGGDRRFTLSTALTLEQESGPNTGYTLTGIIYVGGAHFSARFKDDSERWWVYDGMVNSGRPSLDPVTNITQLTTLRDRVMYILLYRLDSAIITGST